LESPSPHGNRHISVIVPAILHVTDARVLPAYKLWLRFNDGAEGVADLRYDLDAPVFEPLKDPAHFAAGRLDPMLHTVVWPGDADFAPEFLRSRITTASA
jgi:hypothetical protein